MGSEAEDPGTQAKAEAGAVAEGQQQQGQEQQQDEAPMAAEVTLEVELPTGTVLTLPNLSKAEGGLGIRQALADLPETCFYTSYALVAKGMEPRTEINEFLELTEYPFLEDGSRLKLVPEDYDVKRARTHVRRFKDMLAFPPAAPKAPRPAEEDEEAAAAATQQAEAGGQNGAITANGHQEGQQQQEGEDGEEGAGSQQEKEKEKEKELTREEILAIRAKLPQDGAAFAFPLQPSLDQYYTTVMGPAAAPAKEPATPPCLRRVALSAWNPPPAPRRLLGDLAYLEVETLSGAVLHLTAIPTGFYVNRTQSDRFDPTPAANAHFAHELYTVLASAHAPFKKAWAQAVAAATERAAKYDKPLEALALLTAEGKIDAHMIKAPWLVPPPFNAQPAGGATASAAATAAADVLVAKHKADATRAEDDQLHMFGMEPGTNLRDWNEEYQGYREMECKTPGEAIVRAKLVHKTLTEFGEAAVQGATAVVNGFVQPINPNEPRRSQVFVHNNIFFSFAADTANTFKVIGGDRAAFKGALHELRNLQHIARMGIPAKATGGIFTLATSVVDFLGSRVVAQSIIPGILSGEQHSRLVYGSVEPGVKIKADAEIHGKLGELSKAFLLAERALPTLPIKLKPGQEPPALVPGESAEGEGEEEDDGSKTVQFIGPVEWKGIKGADGRCYMLDLLRLTPRDPNWIKEDWRNPSGSGTGVWERAGAPEGVPPLEEDTAAVLRPELIQLYVRTRVMTMKQKIVADFQLRKQAEKEKEKEKAAKKAEGAEAADGKKKEGEEETKEEGEENEGEDEDEEGVALDEATTKLLREEEEELMERLRINPNAFLPLEGIEDQDQQAKDEEQVRVLGRFLWSEALTAYLEQVKQGEMSALDGAMLTETLHSMGINMRYLGRLAVMAKGGDASAGAGATGVTPTGQAQASDAASGSGAAGGAGSGSDAAASGKVGGDEEKRFRHPDFLVHLCEAEMAARAAKHVLFDLLKDRADLRAAPGPTVVAVLNAVLGGCGGGPAAAAAAAGGAQQEGGGKAQGLAAGGGKGGKKKKGGASAAGGNSQQGGSSSSSGPASPAPEHSTGGGGGGGGSSKNKKKKGNKGAAAGGSASAGLSAHAQQHVAGPPCVGKSPDELRALVLQDIKLRFRYASPTLLAHHASPQAQEARAAQQQPGQLPAPASAYWSVPNPNALLRRLCQKLGLRVAARAYDWASREPVALGDVVDIQPVAKHSLPTLPCEPAKELLEAAKLLARQGAVGHAFEYAQEAATIYQQVLGPLSMEVARCWELSATILFQAGDHEVALQQMEKALAVFWQVGGVDCFEAINAHHTLALFHSSLRGHNAEAIAHFRACLYLLELTGGPDSPELPQQYQRLAMALQELGLAQEAYGGFKAAYDKARRCPDALLEAGHAHQLALWEAACGLYKEALSREKRAYAVFRELFGDGHPRTTEASLCMSAFTTKAVEAATSRSNQIRAAMGALAAGGGGLGALSGIGGGGGGGRAGGGGSAGGGGKKGARAVDDEWVPEPAAAGAGGGGGGGGGKKKKKGGKKK